MINKKLDQLCDGLWACYILKSLKEKCYRTYIGSTNSTKRRIRQHNREICGGAKSTCAIYPVEMFCIITGFMNHKMTLQCEWLLKHPENKKKVNDFINLFNNLNNREPMESEIIDNLKDKIDIETIQKIIDEIDIISPKINKDFSNEIDNI